MSKKKSRKLYFVAGLIVALLIAMLITNPSKDKHCAKVDSLCRETMAKFSERDNLNPLASQLGGALIGKAVQSQLDVKNYGIFSVGTLPNMGKGEPTKVTVGFLGMVISLASSEQIYDKIKSKF